MVSKYACQVAHVSGTGMAVTSLELYHLHMNTTQLVLATGCGIATVYVYVRHGTLLERYP